MSIQELGIPYMGSKRKIACKIIDFIKKQNPNVKYIYDLFGGGGAISLCALQTGMFEKVFYNEKNTGIANLFKKIKEDGVTKEFFNWIDRGTFNEYKNKDCWKAGLIKSCWSFGNDQSSYLFSQENELIKKPLHNIIVNKCLQSVEEFHTLTGVSIPENVINGNSFFEESIKERRLRVMRFVKDRIGRFDLQSLESLQSLQRLESLEITNLCYRDVEISTPYEETVIYCDPPYSGTKKYQLDIDHEEFTRWVKDNDYKVYVSSYDFDLDCVLEIVHRSTLSAFANNKVKERLFCNRA
jgi:site-specific DNA-adenine methylase